MYSNIVYSYQDSAFDVANFGSAYLNEPVLVVIFFRLTVNRLSLGVDALLGRSGITVLRRPEIRNTILL